jgi:hypothetical protein
MDRTWDEEGSKVLRPRLEGIQDQDGRQPPNELKVCLPAAFLADGSAHAVNVLAVTGLDSEKCPLRHRVLADWRLPLPWWSGWFHQMFLITPMT